jgi:hypothetical protein
LPWCDECAKFWNPSSMNRAGTCPACGRMIATPPPATDVDGVPADDVEGAPRTPWHFTLLLIALVIYLGYRAFQGIEWLIAHL